MDNKGALKLRVKVGESIFIGDTEVVVSEVFGNSTKLCVKADRSVKILRGKLVNENYYKYDSDKEEL